MEDDVALAEVYCELAKLAYDAGESPTVASYRRQAITLLEGLRENRDASDKLNEVIERTLIACENLEEPAEIAEPE